MDSCYATLLSEETIHIYVSYSVLSGCNKMPKTQ